MTSQQPYMTTANGQRKFACSAVAVLVFIINEKEEILLMAHPKRGGSWEVVNGALEAGETLLDGALREMREEAGEDVRARPLGTVHVSTFHYDETVRYFLSIGYLMAYEDGSIQPGDDMAGSQYKWWSLSKLADEKVKLLIPPDGKWMIERAVELYRLWKEKEVELQPALLVPKVVKAK